MKLHCVSRNYVQVKWHSVSKTLQFEWGMTDYSVQDEHERPGYKGFYYVKCNMYA